MRYPSKEAFTNSPIGQSDLALAEVRGFAKNRLHANHRAW
jgi:hypothetical protein